MHIEQIYTGCLAQGAYYIHSNGEAAIIDPLRETAPYLERLEKDGVKLKYIFETHFHADFVSGHVSLAQNTGADIIYGPTAETLFASKNAEDGEIFKVGDIIIKALHTPGHTIESTCYLLLDAVGDQHCIFTGDTLFLGDVGRPDLCQKGSDITEKDLAGMLYDSLRNKIMPLSDDIKVYPAHGAGSACGKSMMKITVDTLGNQKKMNYALRADMTKDEFINEVTDGLMSAPAYFPLNVKLNKEGYDHVNEVMEKGMRALSADEFEKLMLEPNTVVLDVRSKDEFAKAHVPKSIYIGLDGSFAPWVGTILKDINRRIILITPAEREKETIKRLSRVGFDNTLGYLDGGLETWKRAGKQAESITQISAEDFLSLSKEKEVVAFDVRKPGEYGAAHLENVSSLPLSSLEESLSSLPTETPIYQHCQSGYRSMVAASLMRHHGYDNVIDIIGGFKALKASGATLIETTCSRTAV